MNKGQKTKLLIQNKTRDLILDKGYTAVTMTDIAKALQLSIGGLYHHYHSVESIVLDIIRSGTGEVWEQVTDNQTFQDCLASMRAYFELEKADLLNFNNSLNNIIYQYYFSFPGVLREEKMKDAYQETISGIETVFGGILLSKDIPGIANHIFVVLHGLNLLAMTGAITEKIIDFEFDHIICQVTELYQNQVEVIDE